MSSKASAVISRQFTGITETPYFSSIFSARFIVSSLYGSALLRRTTKGFLISLSSPITLSSASSYSALGISVILPSVVTTIPTVEWSFITFLVPSSAASLNSIGLSDQGVITILGFSSSICPMALSTT